jgi:hypothetical protein
MTYPGVERVAVVSLFIDALRKHLEDPEVIVVTAITDSQRSVVVRECEAIVEIVAAKIRKHEKDNPHR